MLVFPALLATLLLAQAMPRGEAYLLAAMLALLFYLAVVPWAFAEPRLMRLAAVICGNFVTTLSFVQPAGQRSLPPPPPAKPNG